MKRKKFSRIVALFLALTMCCSIASLPATASSRAVTIPTQYAPDSWYNDHHQWTATYYTYSSYIFTYMDIGGVANSYIEVFAYAPKPFTLELYSAETNQLVYREEASPCGDPNGYAARGWFSWTIYIEDFYIILRNNASTDITLSDNAYYRVSRTYREK